MGLLAALKAAFARMAASIGLFDFWENIRQYDTWTGWASDIGRGTVDGARELVTKPLMVPAMTSEFAINRTIDGWNHLKTSAPRTAAGIVGTGKFAKGVAMLPMRILSGGGGGGHSVPAAVRTPTKTMNTKPAEKSPTGNIPIQGAEKLMCVIDHLRAKPDERKTHRLTGLNKFEKAVFFGAFTDGHSADRMKQLVGMKDHEILQLFKKTVKDERTRLNEQSRAAKKPVKASPSINTGGLHAGDIKELAKRLERKPSTEMKAKKVEGEVVKMPQKAAMSAASSTSFIGADLLEQVSARTRQMTADRQLNFLPEETENPGAGMTPA